MNIAKFDRQRGLSFSGFIQGAFILVLLSVLGLKLLPVYMQNGEIKQLFTTIANDPEMQKASLRDIRNSYSRRSSIDNITAINAEDIDIDREGDKPVLSASYAVKIPLAGNMSLYLDFNPSSADK
ncbi:MAG: DUF4845 domain-containing protein [Gallionella sp.]|jgi:hypothetical protein|nr:DUF4845 domain-containing protein [Gallionella sp.]MDP1594490.1 DUF4845 domain-containing protein [Gallionella sp.]MDP1939572.1 DUF4845 domain-containing protein [Gallionella sp.]